MQTIVGGVGGWEGPGPTDRKYLWCFLFAFISPQLILQRGSNGLFQGKQTIIFQGSRGVQHFPGGGGVQLLIPM